MSRAFTDAATIFRREVLRYRRDRAYWVGQTVFPLAVIGFLSSLSLPDAGAYVGHLASGILVLLVGSGAVGGGFSLIEDRQSGFLRALLIAPVSRTSIVVGKLAARAGASLVLVLVLLAPLALLTPLRLHEPAALVLSVVAVTATFVALGIALASRLRRLESFRLLAALVTVPLYLLSGILYPISTLPAPLRALAYANPLTYGADLLRFGLLGVHEIPPAWSAGLLLGLGAAAVAASVRIFDRAPTD